MIVNTTEGMITCGSVKCRQSVRFRLSLQETRDFDAVEFFVSSSFEVLELHGHRIFSEAVKNEWWGKVNLRRLPKAALFLCLVAWSFTISMHAGQAPPNFCFFSQVEAFGLDYGATTFLYLKNQPLTKTATMLKPKNIIH